MFPKDDDLYPIHYICCKGDRDVLNMYLDSHQDEIHRPTTRGLTTLHLAVVHSKYDILEELLSRGVEVDSRDQDRGYTPLHLAVEKRNMGAVKRLVDDGLADLHVKDNTGESPKQLAERMKSKTILKYFAGFESKQKFERDMQQMAAEQMRQKEQTEKLAQRSSLLEEQVDDIRQALRREMTEQIKAETRRIANEQYVEAAGGHAHDARRLSVSNPSRPPPPIPPRKRADSAASSIPSFHAVPTSSPSTLTPSNRVSQTVKDKIDWWTNKTASKTSLAHDEQNNDNVRSRHSSANQGQQLSLNLNDSRQRLLSSPFGSHVDLNPRGVNESDRTSGFGGSHDITEEGMKIESVFCIINKWPLFRYRAVSCDSDARPQYYKYNQMTQLLYARMVINAVYVVLSQPCDDLYVI